MEGEGILQTIAELAVALAGFSSVVIALRGAGPDAWTPQDRVGLGNVLFASLAAFAISLVPFPLAAFGLPSEAIWHVSSGLLGASMGGATGYLANRARRHPPRTPAAFWSFVSSGSLFSLVLLAYAGGLFETSGLGLLLVGLLWVLLAAFTQLFTFLMFT